MGRDFQNMMVDDSLPLCSGEGPGIGVQAGYQISTDFDTLPSESALDSQKFVCYNFHSV
jgi:hypothetical protein